MILKGGDVSNTGNSGFLVGEACSGGRESPFPPSRDFSRTTPNPTNPFYTNYLRPTNP